MPDDEIPDSLVVLKAELDQMLMLAPEIARAGRTWFDAFVDRGFTRQQALYLTAVQMVRDPGEAPS